MIKSFLKIAVVIGLTILMSGEMFAFEKAVLKGRVLDIDGNVVQGAEIFVYRTSDTRGHADFVSTVTNVWGGYQVSLPARKYWIVARLRHGGEYGPLQPGDRHSGEPIELDLKHAGEYKQDFMVMNLMDADRLMKKTRENYFRIKGKIIDRDGMPVRGVYVFANTKSGLKEIPDYMSEWTDAEGRYTLFLPDGKYYVGFALRFPMLLHDKITRELSVKTEMEDIDFTARFTD